MNACEPGQVRKEAAVSKYVHVPEERLARAVQQECRLGRINQGQVHGPEILCSKQRPAFGLRIGRSRGEAGIFV